VVPYLRRYRPELEMVTVETAPAGLTLIRGLDSRSQWAPEQSVVAEFARLDFDYCERYRTAFFGAIPSDQAAVEAFCRKTPVQSSVWNCRRRWSVQVDPE
jgi:hypothetical protein